MASPDFSPVLDDAGRTWNVDPALLHGIMQTESSGNPKISASPAGAQGLMQFMPATAAAYGVNPSDPVSSIYGAAHLMSDLIDQHGNPINALKGYNAGSASRWNNPETAAYPNKVLTAAAAYRPATPPAGGVPAPAATQAAAVDPDVALGSAILAGKVPAAAPAAASVDPDVAAGMATLAAPLAATQSPSAAAAPQTITDAHPIDQASLQVPLLHNLAAGLTQGAQAIPSVLNRAAAYVDGKVPVLAKIDNALGYDFNAAHAQDVANQQAFDASPEGNSLVGQVGQFAGQVATTAPVLGLAGGALGVGGNALTRGAAAISPALERGVAAAGQVLTGSAAGPAGVTGAGNALANMAVRGTSMAAAGAGAGAGYGALTAGASDDSVAQSALAGAKGGAIAAPVLGGLGNALMAGANKLTGRTAVTALQAEIDAAVARSKGQAASNAAAPASAETTPPSAATPAHAGAAPTPGMGAAPVSESIGAAATTPADLAANAMTPAQAEASRATGFNYRLSQQAPLHYDDTVYVPGSTPTLAEATADPALAAQQRVIAPGNEDFALKDRLNNEARLDYFDNIAGTPTTVETMKAARSAQADTDLAAAFANKGTADAQPVVDAIQSILAGPAGKRGPVIDAMNKALAPLYDAKGALETDPEMLYGARQNVTDLLSKTAAQEKPGLRLATSQLAQVKDALDAAIEPAAPGYQQYLQNYSNASRPIDAQEVLQGYRPSLLDAKGNMQLNRVNQMMKSVGQHMAAPGTNPAKSLTDDHVDQLFNLRQDLLRQSNRDMQRPAGSDTAHNLGVLNEIGINAATAGAHVIASHVPGGNLLLGTAMNQINASNSAKAKAFLTNKLLAAPSSTPLQGGY